MPDTFRRLKRLPAVALAVLAVSGSASFAQEPSRGGAMQLLEADANGDRQLTKTELATFQKVRFAEVDANSDGSASQDELKAHADSRRATMEAARLKRLDTNSDGQVSDAEKAAAPDRGPGMGKRVGAGMGDSGRGFDRLDADKDGKITLAEFSAPMDRAFTATDANSDGTLTAAEIQAKRPDRKR